MGALLLLHAGRAEANLQADGRRKLPRSRHSRLGQEQLGLEISAALGSYGPDSVEFERGAVALSPVLHGDNRCLLAAHCNTSAASA